MGNFKEDIAKVEAIVLDVDGVMTDGGIIPTPDGDFIRRYDAKDGKIVVAPISGIVLAEY
jgi:3-deoxy-D-manno-octulosonate 8-phosphate phosphatase (KDO 8-P phosphatase)